MTTGNKACSFEACPHEALSKGLCQGHYVQQKKGRELTTLKGGRIPVACSIEGCARQGKTKGLCQTHYAASRRVAMADAKPCGYGPCNRPAISTGLCDGHYQQQRKGQEFRPLQFSLKGKACASNGCDGVVSSHADGLPVCPKHYDRWRRTGDINGLTQRMVVPLGMACIAEAVANRDRSGCWADWADLDCWEGLGRWGGNHANGYAMLGATKVMHLALIADGRPRPPAPAHFGLHSCHNKACWNPDHLEWGSHEQNMSDNAGRIERYVQLIAWLDARGIEYPEELRP